MDAADNHLIGGRQQFAHRAPMRGTHINVEDELPVPEALDQRINGRDMLLGDEDSGNGWGRCGMGEVQDQPLSHRVGSRLPDRRQCVSRMCYVESIGVQALLIKGSGWPYRTRIIEPTPLPISEKQCRRNRRQPVPWYCPYRS